MKRLIKKDENIKIDNNKANQLKKPINNEKQVGKKRKFPENSDISSKKIIKNEKFMVPKDKKLIINESDDKKIILKMSENKEKKQSKLNKIIKSEGSIGDKNKFKNSKRLKFNKEKKKNILIASTPAERKELLKKRKQKKLAENYEVTINMKKIWETLRKSDTTEETKKKLCSSLYEQVKGRIKIVDFKNFNESFFTIFFSYHLPTIQYVLLNA